MTLSIDNYDSMWEWTKSKSKYHFDKWKQESHGEYFRVLGRLPNTWNTELSHIIEQAVPRTWENITYSGNQNQKPISTEKRRFDIAKGGGDLSKIELTDTFDDFTNFPELQKAIDYFGLAKIQARCHVQKTGQMFTTHIDPLSRLFTGTEIADPDAKYDYVNDIVRITIMLQDWQPGQFKQFGNYVFQQWKAGDYYIHDWENVPHSTANASEHVRVTLQLTGLITDKTRQIIGNTHSFKGNT